MGGFDRDGDEVVVVLDLSRDSRQDGKAKAVQKREEEEKRLS